MRIARIVSKQDGGDFLVAFDNLEDPSYQVIMLELSAIKMHRHYVTRDCIATFSDGSKKEYWINIELPRYFAENDKTRTVEVVKLNFVREC